MMKVLLSVLGLTYLVSPYDLFPDFFVGVGWLDDLIVLGVLWWYLYVYKRRQLGYQRDGRPGPDQNQTRASGDGKRDSDSKEEKAHYSRSGDPYTVLNVDRKASQKEIREAYLALAQQYHPDKVGHLGEEFIALAENRFKEIQSAYEVLRVK